MADIETVKVVKANRAGYATINKSDYNPEKHELFGVEAESGKDELIEKALELKLGTASVLKRWSVERLQTAIDEAESGKDEE